MLAPLTLDIRTPQEYAQGHLPDAILVPTRPPPEADWQLTRRYLGYILGGKSYQTPIYVYCKLGKRSGVAAQMLREMGFQNVVDMGGVEQGYVADKLATGELRLVGVP